VNDQELSSILDQEIANSVGYFDGKLADQRRKAMDYYLGEPFGNETEGRSQFVSRDVADTIEGILPSLLKIFTASDEVVKFEPQGPEDQKPAEQASDYINHVFNRQNNGFVVLYTFFKDALLQKNGYCKVYWDTYSRPKVEKYKGLTPEELTMIAQQLQEQGYEIQAIETTEDETTFRLVDKVGKVCIDPIPPEEMRVNKNAKFDLQKERFVAHERKVSATELRLMDIEPDDYELEKYPGDDWNLERQTRYGYEQEDTLDDEKGTENQYLVRECYILVDYDGDGIAERRMIWKSGKEILRNEEVDRVPIVSTTPIMMPHKHFGLSVADLVSDLQLLKSTLIRQILDNMYLTNSPRMQVIDGMVNIDDLLTVRPGGIVRMKTFDAAKPLPVPFFGAPAFNMLEYVDTIRENRTGVTRYNQGLDANSLNKTATGINNIMNAAQQRIELIARIFAETGVKDMMWQIFELVCKHEAKSRVVRLRNEWVPIDPRQWSTKWDMTVSVGLGTGSKDQLLQGAQLIGQFQQAIAQAGGLGRVVTEQNIFNLGNAVAEAVMPKKGHMFFTNPEGLPAPEEKPDPKIEMQKEKAYMADKTKRDLAAVDLIKEVFMTKSGQNDAEATRQAQLMDKESENRANLESQMGERDFQREMKDREFGHQKDMMLNTPEQKAAADQSTLINAMASLVETVKQSQEVIANSQVQVAQSIENMNQALRAPKTVIRDKNGRAVGVKTENNNA
jgi:hypothetical protein